MYVGIDVGGTKTLVASVNDRGTILHDVRFPTPHDYQQFLKELEKAVRSLPEQDFRAGGIGIAASELDREHGMGIAFGNLPWRGVYLRDDAADITRCRMAFDNDAKMGALGEAVLRPDARSLLYVTIGTGIGVALVIDGKVDQAIGDAGGKTMLIEWHGKLVPWESFASGHAIFERFGKKASEIEDDAIWQEIAHDISLGMVELTALAEPDVIVVGGGVGTHYGKYKAHLEAILGAYSAENPMLLIPPIEAAKRPEQAVIYGCFEAARRMVPADAA